MLFQKEQRSDKITLESIQLTVFDYDKQYINYCMFNITTIILILY